MREKLKSKADNKRLRARTCAVIFVVFLKCTLEKGLRCFQHWRPTSTLLVQNIKKTRPPYEESHHLELHTSELCNDEQIRQYQTLIGQLMWAVTLGRFDIAASVMTTSSSLCRTPPMSPKDVAYMANLPHGAIRYRTHEPEYSDLPHKDYDWAMTVYTCAREELPHNLPKPLGKQVTSTHYVDANLHHDLITGKAVTAILHMLNATPVHRHCKRQLTVETETFGSEFVAPRTTANQINDFHLKLIYMGIPINPKSYMLGDKKAVVTNATISTSTLSTRYHLAAYHRVLEATAAGYLQVHWKDGKSNPTDILSKHWGSITIWPLLQPLLFWRGDTSDLVTKSKGSDRIPTRCTKK